MKSASTLIAVFVFSLPYRFSTVKSTVKYNIEGLGERDFLLVKCYFLRACRID